MKSICFYSQFAWKIFCKFIHDIQGCWRCSKVAHRIAAQALPKLHIAPQPKFTAPHCKHPWLAVSPYFFFSNFAFFFYYFCYFFFQKLFPIVPDLRHPLLTYICSRNGERIPKFTKIKPFFLEQIFIFLNLK